MSINNSLLPFITERNLNKNKTEKMKKNYIIYFLIFISIVLMIYNILELDFYNLKKGPFAGIVSNILLILAMLITIRDIKKKENN